jgi:hypothetical protein
MGSSDRSGGRRQRVGEVVARKGGRAADGRGRRGGGGGAGEARTGGGGGGAAGGPRGDGHGRPRVGGCCDRWREGTAGPLEIAQLASLGGIIFLVS